MGQTPTSAQVPIVEHPDVRRMLLAQKSYVEGGLALCLFAGTLVDDLNSGCDEAERTQSLLDVLTPIVKSWPSQWCLVANDLAIQVMGGAGYTRDFDVEQHYRDNRLNPIHEGSHGIQALDLLGRKVLGTHGRGLMVLADAMTATADRGESQGGEAAALAQTLRDGVQRLGQVTGDIAALGSPELMLANATTYLEACGHLVVGWIWLEQYLATADNPGPFYEGKRQAARYFFRWELPRIGPMLDLLAAGDDTVLATDPNWL